jgi:methylated-DNA-[protein]-cysteine S-methyltransferase
MDRLHRARRPLAAAPRLSHRTTELGSPPALRYPARVRLYYHVMSAPGPLGLLFLVRSERGLRYLQFMERKSLKRMIARFAPENPGAEWQPSLLELKPVVEQLDAYFCGTLEEFELRLDVPGTEFQCAVWQELGRTPFAVTRTYGDLAKAVGQPRSARAVGLAANQNPVLLVVPCHRVIGADGKLTGYSGGLPRKRWLLEHERRFAELKQRSEPVLVASTRPAPDPRATTARPRRRPARRAVAAAAPRARVAKSAR